MADKLKRLNKILVKKGLKGQLRPVETLEEAHTILIENKQCVDKTALVGKDTYKELIEEGHCRHSFCLATKCFRQLFLKKNLQSYIYITLTFLSNIYFLMF